MDTLPRRIDALEQFFQTHATSWADVLTLADTLLLAVSQTCPPDLTAQVAQRFEAILAAAFPPTPPKH